MNPADLIDFRPDDGPLGLWDYMVVLSVHHDIAGEVPTDWQAIIDHVVRDLLSSEFPRRKDVGRTNEISQNNGTS